MVFGFSWWDWYFLVNLVLILPIVRVFMRHAYRQDSVEFETYKDKALRLHHEDAQANHKNRAWSANGVTANHGNISIHKLSRTRVRLILASTLPRTCC